MYVSTLHQTGHCFRTRDYITQIGRRGTANVTSLSTDIVNSIKRQSNLVDKSHVSLVIPELMAAVQKHVYHRGNLFLGCRSCFADDTN